MLTAIIILEFVILIVASASLAIGIWSFYKIRKIHLATFRITRSAEKASSESSSLFSQLHALYSLEKRLDLDAPLPPTRGYAGSPDFLLTVADAILTRKPQCVVECSSGVSTLVIARCLQINGSGHVYSLEHDKTYADQTVEMLNRYGVDDRASVLYAPLTRVGGETPWYDDTVFPEDMGPIEVLVVDGPPYDTAPLARLPALSRLAPRMAEAAFIILDDAARDSESEIVKRWAQLAPEFKVQWLNHEKGCAILER